MPRTAELWTNEEVEILKMRQLDGMGTLTELLPNRSYWAIANKLSRLPDGEKMERAVTDQGEPVIHRNPWTKEEIEILKTMGPICGISELERLIPMHNRISIYNYARRHNLPIKESKRGIKQRFSDSQIEYVLHFAPKVGYRKCASAIGITICQAQYIYRRYKKYKKEEKG